MRMADFLFLLALLSPTLLAAFVAFAKNQRVAGFVDRVTNWHAANHIAWSESDSAWRKYLVRPLLWPFKKLGDWTASMQDRCWMSAARIFGYGYLAILFLLALAILTYMVFVLVIAIGAIARRWFSANCANSKSFVPSLHRRRQRN